MTPLAASLYSAMVTLAPPAKLAALPPIAPQWAETAEERSARYEAIAGDAAAVALDVAESPLPGRSRADTAATLIALAFEESGFAPDADRGPCHRGANGKNARCDSGRSACMLQLHIGAGTTKEGWTQADLFADRTKCFRAGLHLARRSFAACASMGPTHLLDSFASGVCGLGNAKGAKRLATAARVAALIAPVSTTGAKGAIAKN